MERIISPEKLKKLILWVCLILIMGISFFVICNYSKAKKQPIHMSNLMTIKFNETPKIGPVDRDRFLSRKGHSLFTPDHLFAALSGVGVSSVMFNVLNEMKDPGLIELLHQAGSIVEIKNSGTIKGRTDQNASSAITENHIHAKALKSVEVAKWDKSKELRADLQDEPEKPRFNEIVVKAARRYRVDPALVHAIIRAESSYNPKAISRVGAKGLMQLMPMTARELGVVDILDPHQNIDAGVRYFSKLLEQFNGNVKLALAAYNAGSGKVRQYRGVPPYKETRFYIKKVYKYYRDHKQKYLADIDHVYGS